MKKNMYIVLAGLLLFTACDKTTDPVATIKNEIKVKVYSTTSWSAATNKMDTVTGATVSLTSDEATVTAITDNKGVASFTNLKEKTYGLVVTKGDLSSLINTSTINNQAVGYLITGVYSSQEDILSSPINSAAVVGGPKLMDVNGDGQINNNDKVQGYYLDFEFNYQDVNNDEIIDVKDIVDGNLVKTDKLVEETIYIGK